MSDKQDPATKLVEPRETNPCPRCGGRGVVTIKLGLGPTDFVCLDCRGTGVDKIRRKD